MTTSDLLDNLTVLIKTFERPKELDRLIKSIKCFYPSLKILVADDSRRPCIRRDVEYYELPYNIGLSAGRNFLLNKVMTKYFALFDDDHVCTKNTKLCEMISILEHNPIDLVGGDFINEGIIRSCFQGIYEINNGILVQHIGKNKGKVNGYPLYDVVHNFFVARTELVKNILWDENIWCGREHADFFLRCRGRLNITYSPKFSVNHFQGLKLYKEDRKKNRMNILIFNKKWHIKDKTYHWPILDRIRNNISSSLYQRKRKRILNKKQPI